MNRGFVKIWRKTRDTGLNCVQLGLWTSCLLESAHKPRTVFVASQQVELQAGQFVFGRSEWTRRLGLSDKSLRYALAALIKRGMISASTRASKFTVYSVVNWALYQVCEQCEGPAEGPTQGPAEGQQRASRGPHIKNIENLENGENEKKESNTSCADLSVAERTAPDEIALEPAVFLLPLNTGDQYPITETALCQLEPLYPAVNVREEFRKMLGWFIGNPAKRKTKKGIMRFVTSWLSKAQDRGSGMAQGQLRVNSVYQQKQVEGSQKAKLLNEIRRAEDEQRRNAEVATAGRLALPGEDGRGRDSGNGGPVDGCVIELQPAGD